MAYHLAQLNIARMKSDNIDDPIMATFVAQIAEINGRGEQSEGFVWRMKDEENDNATGIQAFPDPRLIINLTVWESLEALEAFAFKGRHLEVMRNRREWFEKSIEATTVLWWIPAGHIPTLDEAKERLELLRSEGATTEAFNFRQKFPSPVF
jgi:Domain of unknown function (DUF3291)